MKIYIAGPMRGIKYFNFPAFDAMRDRIKKEATTLVDAFIPINPADMDREHGFDFTKLKFDSGSKEVWDEHLLMICGFDLKATMKRDLEAIGQCDAIILLRGWGSSEGAIQERAKASAEDLLIVYEKDLQSGRGVWELVQDAWLIRARASLNFIMNSQTQPELTSLSTKTRFASPSRTVTKPSARVEVLEEAKTLVSGERNASYGPPDQDFARTAGMWTALLQHKLRERQVIRSQDVAWMMMLLKGSRAQHSAKRDNYVDAAGYAACGWECEKINSEKGKDENIQSP